VAWQITHPRSVNWIKNVSRWGSYAGDERTLGQKVGLQYKPSGYRLPYTWSQSEEMKEEAGI
jgi:hypothetical protein